MKWTNEIILEFLQLYEKEPAIWDPRHIAHKDRFTIADAWRRIEANLSVPCPIEELKRKKDSLMATFRSLTIKVKSSIDSANGAEYIYKPNWFAYDSMAKFLDGIYQPRTHVNKEDNDDSFRLYDHEQLEQDSRSPIIEDVAENDDDSKHSFLETGTTFKLPPERKLKRKRDMVRPDMSNCACEIQDKDECSLFTQLLTAKLRSFDDHTRDILMHEIDNLVFRTKMQKRRKLDNSPSNSDDFNYNPSSLIDDTETYSETYLQRSIESEGVSVPISSSSHRNSSSRNDVVVKSEM